MVVKLIIASGKNAGRAISIKRNKLLIGRAEECDVRPLSEAVSRRHCAVHVGPAEVFVEDLGSRNGTFVNGQRIAGKLKVVAGDVIRVGALELKVSSSDPAAHGTEEDVSRWLMADEMPAGMFDTTQSIRAVPAEALQPAGISGADSASGSIHATIDVAGGEGSSEVIGSGINGGLVSGISSAAAGAEGQSVAGSNAGSSAAIEAIKAAKGKPGTLPKAAGTNGNGKSADSSRDAAAEALKKFFGNR